MSDTTADLIARVKNRETIPDSGTAYSDTNLLDFLDQSLKGFIIPAVEATLEEHFVVTMDFEMPLQPPYPANNPPVNVVNWVNIPGESTGLRLRDVYVVGNDGSPYNLPRLTPTQAAAQSYGNPYGPAVSLNNNQLAGGFFLQGNQLQIFPYGLASQKTIRITYQRQPADLCLTTQAGQVVSKTGDVLVLDKALTNWYAGTLVSVSSAFAPHDYVPDSSVPNTVYTSLAPLNNIPLVSFGGNVATLPVGSAANVQVGDWVCLAGQSVFAQNIPKEVLPALVQKAASMCLESAGDAEGWKTAETTFNTMLKLLLGMIAPRVIGKPVKILPVNSPFKASRGSNWSRY